jgi:hypothetical protein
MEKFPLARKTLAPTWKSFRSIPHGENRSHLALTQHGKPSLQRKKNSRFRSHGTLIRMGKHTDLALARTAHNTPTALFSVPIRTGFRSHGVGQRYEIFRSNLEKFPLARVFIRMENHSHGTKLNLANAPILSKI